MTFRRLFDIDLVVLMIEQERLTEKNISLINFYAVFLLEIISA